MSEADSEGLGYAPLFFLLFIPICCSLYVLIRYHGKEVEYMQWRFSHSDPKQNFRYMPKERRDALWHKIKNRGPPPGPTSTDDVVLTEKE